MLFIGLTKHYSDTKWSGINLTCDAIDSKNEKTAILKYIGVQSMRPSRFIWLTAGALAGFVLSELVRSPAPVATAQDAKQPFANSTDQRQQTVEELRRLNALMQKQIDLLTSGKVRVTVVDEKAEGAKR